MGAAFQLFSVFQLLVIVQMVTSIYFYDDNEYMSHRVFNHDFFAEENVLTGNRRSDIFSLSGTADFSVGKDWCGFKSNEAGGVVTATVETGNCQVPSFHNIVNNILKRGPDAPDLLKSVTKMMNGELFQVESIIAIKASGILQLKTKARSGFRLFGYLEVGAYSDDPAMVEFSWNKNVPMSETNLEVKLSGASQLGSFKAQTEIVKGMSDPIFEIKKLDTGNAKVKLFSDIATKFTIYPPGIAREEDNFKYSSLAQLSWNDMFGYGAFTINDDFQIVLETKSTESHTSVFGFAGHKTKFIMSRFNKGNPFGSFLFKMPSNKNILEIVKPVLTYPNIRALPMLRRFADRPWCIMLSGKNGKFMQSARILSEMDFCFPKGTPKEISAGFNLKIWVELKKNLQDEKCGATPEQVQQLPDIALLQGAITQQAVKFTFPSNYNTPLRATINCMGGESFSDLPFNVFNEEGPDKEPIFQIQEFSYNPPQKDVRESKMYFRITIVLTLPSKYRTIPNTKIGLGPFKVHIQTNAAATGWDVIGLTTIKFNGIDVLVQLGYSAPNWKFVLQIPSITITQIKDAFHNTPGATNPADIKAVENFGIKNLALEWTINKSGKTGSVKIRGNPIIFGYDGAHIEGIWWRPKNTGKVYVNNEYTKERILADQPVNAYAIAVWFKSINLDWFLKKFLGEETMSVSFFSNMNGLFAVSNALGIVKKAVPGDNPKLYTKAGEKRGYQHVNVKTKHLKTGDTKLPHVINKRSPSHIYHETKLQRTIKQLNNVKRADTAELIKEPEVGFSIPGLAGTAIRPGVSIMLQWKMPAVTTECFDNKICTWMVENIGTGGHIQLVGYFKQKGSLEIMAKMGGMNKWIVDQVLKFDEIILKLKIGLYDPSFRLQLSVLYNNKDLSSSTLKFFGAIEVGFTGKLTLEAGMGGVIEHPWDVQQFSLGNLFISAGVSIGALPFPAIQAGAMVMLGTVPDCSNENTICVQGYFGFDPNRVTDFWVFAKVNKLTFPAICNAFEFTCTVPKPLEDFGFPEGLTISYSNPAGDGKIIPAIGLNAPPGLFISGKVKLFDIEMWGKIIVQTKALEIDIKMKPITWIGGLIKVQRSEDDNEQGPICFIRVVQPNYFRVNIEGYGQVIGMKAKVNITVSESEFKFQIAGAIIPAILEGETKLAARYGNLKEMEFEMLVDIYTSKFAKTLAKAISDLILKYGDQAKQAIDNAKLKVDAAVMRVNEAKKPVEDWQKEIDEWKQSLQIQLDELNEKKASMETDCKAACPKVCIGFLEWHTECWKCFGYWVGCAKWNSCYTKTDDVFCLAGCEISKIAKKFMIWFEQAAIKIKMAMGEVGKGLGEMAKGVLTAAAAVVDFGNSVLEFAKTSLDGIQKAAQYVAENADRFLVLRTLKLFAKMTKTFDACVGYEIDCTIFGNDLKHKGNACLNIEFLYNLVYGITATKEVDNNYPKLSQAKKNLELTDGKLDALDDVEKEFNKDKLETRKEIDEEKSKKYTADMKVRSAIARPDMIEYAKNLPKRTTVPNEEEMKFIEAASDPIPDYDVRNEYITNAFMKASPWKLMEDMSVVGLNEHAVKDDTQTGTIRSLDFESDMSSCERIKRALVGYKDLTNGLLKTASALHDKNDAFSKYKRSMNEKKNDIYQQIQDMESRHNLTNEDRADAYFWYSKIEDGLSDLSKRSEMAMNKQDMIALPIIRRQLSEFLKKEKGKTFEEFADFVHYNAISGFKRSKIPTPEDVNGEEMLTNIKKELISMVTDEDNSLSQMNKRLHDVRYNIHLMASYTKNCRNH